MSYYGLANNLSLAYYSSKLKDKTLNKEGGIEMNLIAINERKNVIIEVSVISIVKSPKGKWELEGMTQWGIKVVLLTRDTKEEIQKYFDGVCRLIQSGIMRLEGNGPLYIDFSEYKGD